MDAGRQRRRETGRVRRIREQYEHGLWRAGHGLLQCAWPADRGQADVEDARVGLLAHGQLHRGVKAGHASDDIVTGPVQQRLEGGGEDTVRVGDHDSHLEYPLWAGTRTVTASPPRSLAPK